MEFIVKNLGVKAVVADEIQSRWDFTPPQLRALVRERGYRANVERKAKDNFEGSIAEVFFAEKLIKYYEKTRNGKKLTDTNINALVHYHELGHVFDLELGGLSHKAEFFSVFASERMYVPKNLIDFYDHYLAYDRPEFADMADGKGIERGISLARRETYAQMFAEIAVTALQHDILQSYPKGEPMEDVQELTLLMPSTASIVRRNIEEYLPEILTPLAPFRNLFGNAPDVMSLRRAARQIVPA